VILLKHQNIVFLSKPPYHSIIQPISLSIQTFNKCSTDTSD